MGVQGFGVSAAVPWVLRLRVLGLCVWLRVEVADFSVQKRNAGWNAVGKSAASCSAPLAWNPKAVNGLGFVGES